MDAKTIPPSRNDSPNSPLLYTGNDAKDIRRRGHSTPETGVERWFSVCWAGVDRRSSFGAYRCNRDTCGWVTIPSQRKRKKKKKNASWALVNRSTRKITRRVFKSNVKYNVERGENQASVWQREIWQRVEAGRRMLLSWKFDRREHNREGWFETPVEWFHSRWACSSSICLSLFRPFCAPIPVSWLCLGVVGSWFIRVCLFRIRIRYSWE